GVDDVHKACGFPVKKRALFLSAECRQRKHFLCFTASFAVFYLTQRRGERGNFQIERITPCGESLYLTFAVLCGLCLFAFKIPQTERCGATLASSFYNIRQWTNS